MSETADVPVLELQNVSRRYGKTLAVDDFSLVVAPGEVIGLVGDNGAGKSTLIKMISGYVSPSSGVIKVMGLKTKFRSPRDA